MTLYMFNTHFPNPMPTTEGLEATNSEPGKGEAARWRRGAPVEAWYVI